MLSITYLYICMHVYRLLQNIHNLLIWFVTLVIFFFFIFPFFFFYLIDYMHCFSTICCFFFSYPFYFTHYEIILILLYKYREKPLALYVMSNSDKTINLFMNETSSGGFCSNDLLSHFSGINKSLPLPQTLFKNIQIWLFE